jgi:MFS family permease
MRSPKLGALITGRVIAGIGEGLFLGTLVVYICEIAPARRRGPLASLIQFLVTIGLATGYFIAYGTARIQKFCGVEDPTCVSSIRRFLLLNCMFKVATQSSIIVCKAHGRRSSSDIGEARPGVFGVGADGFTSIA